MENSKLILLPFCTSNQRELVAEAEKRKLPVEILVTEKNMFDTLTQRNIRYLVGVCCPTKISSISPRLQARGISYMAIEAKAEGLCFKKSGVKRAVDMGKYCEALDWLESQ